MVSTSTTTTVATASSARCGTRVRGCTVARARGSSALRAIAKVVRLTPTVSDNRTPSAAIVAPTRTTTDAVAKRPDSTAATSGAGADANAVGPAASSADTATTA